MSKGSDRFTIRIQPALLNRIRQDIANREKSGWREQLSIGEWIKLAVLEKLEHMRRSRKASRKRTKNKTISRKEEQEDFCATLSDFPNGNPDIFPAE